MTTQATTPTNTFDERLAFRVRTTFELESGLARGWAMGDEPEVQAAITAKNEAERARCKAALLASLKL